MDNEIKMPKFIEHTIKNKKFNKANFYYLMEKLDWTKQGDDDAVLEPLVDYLSKWDDIVIFAFHEYMAQLLYDIDTKEIASIYENEEFGDDAFLYARCVAIINGPTFYDKILDGTEDLDPDLWFESILYVPCNAWARKHGKEPQDYPYITKLSYESGSNKEGWK